MFPSLPLPVVFAELELISSRLLCPRAYLERGSVLRQVFHCHLLSLRWVLASVTGAQALC